MLASCSPTTFFTSTSPRVSRETRINDKKDRKGDSVRVRGAFPLHLVWVTDFSTLNTHTFSHTHTGVTSAADRNCHTAVSAGAGRHRCSQRGPQSIPPPLGKLRPAVQRDLETGNLFFFNWAWQQIHKYTHAYTHSFNLSTVKKNKKRQGTVIPMGFIGAGLCVGMRFSSFVSGCVVCGGRVERGCVCVCLWRRRGRRRWRSEIVNEFWRGNDSVLFHMYVCDSLKIPDACWSLINMIMNI